MLNSYFDHVKHAAEQKLNKTPSQLREHVFTGGEWKKSETLCLDAISKPHDKRPPVAESLHLLESILLAYGIRQPKGQRGGGA